MTESLGYLHEFETQRPERQDSIGIEIESALTIEIVQQKRRAPTTRSMRNRQRASQRTSSKERKNLLHICFDFHSS